MRLANKHLEEALHEFIEKILSEGRAATREKAAERIRAKLPTPQKTIEQVAPAKISKAKGKHYAVMGAVLRNEKGEILEVEPHDARED